MTDLAGVPTGTRTPVDAARYCKSTAHLFSLREQTVVASVNTQAVASPGKELAVIVLSATPNLLNMHFNLPKTSASGRRPDAAAPTSLPALRSLALAAPAAAPLLRAAATHPENLSPL